MKVVCRLKANLKNPKHINYRYLLQSPFPYELVSQCPGQGEGGKFADTEGEIALAKNQHFRLPCCLGAVASIFAHGSQRNAVLTEKLCRFQRARKILCVLEESGMQRCNAEIQYLKRVMNNCGLDPSVY